MHLNDLTEKEILEMAKSVDWKLQSIDFCYAAFVPGKKIHLYTFVSPCKPYQLVLEKGKNTRVIPGPYARNSKIVSSEQMQHEAKLARKINDIAEQYVIRQQPKEKGETQ